jgi:hypothetical protein
MLVYKLHCDFSGPLFVFYKTVSHLAGVRHMIVYKLQCDLNGSFFGLIKLFHIMLSCAKCLYTSFRTILLYRVWCLSNSFS